MSSHTIITGYIRIHHLDVEEFENYIECHTSYLKNTIFDPYKCRSSGFHNYAICAEFKEYYESDKNEYIRDYYYFLQKLKLNYIYCTLYFESDLEIFPKKVQIHSISNEKWQLEVNEKTTDLDDFLRI